MTKQRIGIIVQARMTSTRFPGKSMALLMGKPVLQHVLEKAKRIEGLSKLRKPWVTLAVPDEEASEPMLEIADELGVGNFMGDKTNVLRRYYEAASFFHFDIIMRITGDCPFINPKLCSECLHLLIWRNLDYCSNSYPKRTFPTGLDCEVFTFDCLEAAHKLATSDYDMEHVTPWMQKEPEVSKFNIVQKQDQSDVNLCVDYPEDIARLEAMFKEGGFFAENKTG